MMNAISKSIIYVSNLASNRLSIINGKNFELIDEIKVGQRPLEMAIDNKNNIFIATDREEKITIINSKTRDIKKIYIPNNGHIKVDSISERIYISNTEEVYVYSLKDFKIIHKITGFMVVDGIELSKDFDKLFVLDIFKNIIKVYDTLSFNILKVYKDIGENLNYIYIDDNNKYLYVGNKGVSKLNISGSITIINFDTEEKSVITLSDKSNITSMESYRNLLYVVDSGENKIKVIDASSEYLVDNIITSLNNPKRLKLLKDEKVLLVTSSDNKGKGALDIIDINTFKILNSFKFQEADLKPYDIEIIKEEAIYKEEDELKEKELKDEELKDEKNDNLINIDDNTNNEKLGEYILANKIIATYKENITFNQEKIKLKDNNLGIEKIIFESCKIIEESKKKEIIQDKEDHLVLSFNYIIPYYIKCINSKKERLIINGSLKGSERAILYINNNEDDNLEIIIKSNTNTMYLPYIKENYIVFDAVTTIFTYAVKEEVIFIPNIEDKIKG